MTWFDFDPKRHALFLDLDGTVIDIAATPDSVVVAPGLVETLICVGERLDGAFAVLSGRALADIDRLLVPFRPAAAGIHGAELRLKAGGPFERVASPLPARVVADIDALAALPGVVVESKTLAIAVHFRNAPDGIEGLIRQRIDELLRRPECRDLSVLAGKCVFEIKPQRVGKGAAVDAFMAVAPYSGRRPVVIGDDVTDEAAFAAVAKYGGFGVAVGAMRPGAAFVIPTPADVRAWLGTLTEDR